MIDLCLQMVPREAKGREVDLKFTVLLKALVKRNHVNLANHNVSFSCLTNSLPKLVTGSKKQSSK